MEVEEPTTPAEELVDSNAGEDPTPAPSSGNEQDPSEPGSEPEEKTPEDSIPRTEFNDRMEKKNKRIEVLEDRLTNMESVKEKKVEEETKKDEWDDNNDLFTKSELAVRDKKFKEDMRRENETTRINNECNSLEKEIDGSDGRPKFIPADVKKHARSNPYDAHPNPKIVYERMHREKLDIWRANKINEKQNPAHVEPTGDSPKEPPKTDTSKMTESEYDEHMRQKHSGK